MRGKEQKEKPGAHRGREPAGQSLGNTGEKPRELGSRREREKHRKYESEGKSLSKTTGNMKKPLTEVGEAAGGTGLGSQVPNGLLWDICSGKVEQSQVQSRRHDSGGGLLSYFKFLEREKITCEVSERERDLRIESWNEVLK